MARERKEEPPKGAPAWTATFGDLMNLLLCFFVLLFSMSSVDAQKFSLMAESFSQAFSIFDGGSSSTGGGILISNGVNQLFELEQYINSSGETDEGQAAPSPSGEAEEKIEEAEKKMEEAGLKESEELSEKVDEAISEQNLSDVIDVEFTSQYVQLTLQGSLLFDSGSTVLKEESLPVLDKIGIMLERYAQSTIEVEGHTDNVPMSGAKYSNNDELSSGRALSVFNYLIEHADINPAIIKHSGRGEYVPIADNSTAEGRALNRRVEIRIYNSLSSY